MRSIPQQSMWWNYRKPKPFKKGRLYIRRQKPCAGAALLYHHARQRYPRGDDGFYVQEYTIADCRADFHPGPI